MLEVGYINKDTVRDGVIIKLFIDIGAKAHQPGWDSQLRAQIVRQKVPYKADVRLPDF